MSLMLRRRSIPRRLPATSWVSYIRMRSYLNQTISKTKSFANNCEALFFGHSLTDNLSKKFLPACPDFDKNFKNSFLYFVALTNKEGVVS